MASNNILTVKQIREFFEKYEGDENTLIGICAVQGNPANNETFDNVPILYGNQIREMEIIPQHAKEAKQNMLVVTSIIIIPDTEKKEKIRNNPDIN